MRRYQIRFNANFTYQIEAEDAEHARLIADEMAANSAGPIILEHEEWHCAWSTITPMTPAGPEATTDDDD